MQRRHTTTWAETVRHQIASRERFERFVLDALDEIPEPFSSRMENLEIIIEDRGVPNLLGLYTGISLDDRGMDYTGALPDIITVYRIPLELRAPNEDVLRREVRTTVLHEVAHHLGIDDDRLDELGWS